MENERLQRLQLDIDLRLAHIWAQIPVMNDEKERDFVGHLLRAAYAVGYSHAHREPTPWALYKNAGYGSPKEHVL